MVRIEFFSDTNYAQFLSELQNRAVEYIEVYDALTTVEVPTLAGDMEDLVSLYGGEVKDG